MCSVAVIGQDIPKMADLIEITSAMPEADLYRIAGQTLVQQGYTINKSDKDFYQIQTEPKDIKGSNANPRLQIGVGKGKITIMRWLGHHFNAYSQLQSNQTRIANRGMKGSPIKLTFEEMDKYARSVSQAVDGSITYKISQ
jgi:hypothetical protein